MKSITLPRAEDKKIVRHALPTSNIFTAAVARLYLAFEQDGNVWKDSGLWGAMAFCKDRQRKDSYFLRLIDMETHRGVIWEQELYVGFHYARDCPFLHSFETDDCLAGIQFVDPGEADVFYDKVLNRDSIKLKDSRSTQKSNDVGRVRFTPGKGFSVDNNDPEVLEILRELEKLEDFSAADIDRNQEFIQDFIRQYRSSNKKTSRRTPPPPPPPSRNRSTKAPAPPPLPPMLNRPNPIAQGTAAAAPPPPPPPVPNRGIRQSPSIPSINLRPPVSAGGAPPPPAPPPPPPPMARGPPIPTGFSGPPPPPPPPPSGGPPASPTPLSSVPPAGGDNRSNLMAAIRSTGGFGSLKKGGTLKAANTRRPESAPISRGLAQNSAASSQSDMASSLAAALEKRKKSALHSDDSDASDDDDDWK
ncbi:hypothetical protein MBANPS3_005869 [Mucor bainieri]